MATKTTIKRPRGRPPTMPRSEEENMRQAQENQAPQAADSERDEEARVLAVVQSEFQENGEDHSWVVRTWEVKREPQKPERCIWIGDYRIDELNGIRHKIAELRGPGRYRVRVIRDNINFQQYDFEIGIDLRLRVMEPAPQLPAAVPPAPASDRFEIMMTRMMDQQARMADEQRQFMRELVTALRPPAAPDPTQQMTQTLALIREVQAVTTPTNSGLEMFRQGMSLAREVAEQAPSSEGGAWGIIERFLSSDAFGALINRVTQAAAAPPQQNFAPAPPALPPRSASPADTQARSNVPAAAASAGAAPTNVGALQAQLPPALVDLKNYLIVKAREGAQPDLLSDYVVRMAGDEFMAYLEQQQDPLVFLETLFPDIVPYRAWFSALVDGLYADAEGEDDMRLHPQSADNAPADPGRTSGNAGNAENHA